MRKSLKFEVIDEIKELALQGKTPKDIAKLLNVSLRTIYYYLPRGWSSRKIIRARKVLRFDSDKIKMDIDFKNKEIHILAVKK